MRSYISGQFLAATGLEKIIDHISEAYLRHFYHKILIEYAREARYERARLMRETPLDYRRVREMDRELEDVTARLRNIEFEQALSK